MDTRKTKGESRSLSVRISSGFKKVGLSDSAVFATEENRHWITQYGQRAGTCLRARLIPLSIAHTELLARFVTLLLLSSLFLLAVPPAHADGNCPMLQGPTDQTDSDGDGVGDVCDSCLSVPNSDQRDTNADGFGNICDADINQDLLVNLSDFSLFRIAYGTNDPDADFNGDGLANLSDFSLFRVMYGSAPGPSGLTPKVDNTRPVADAGPDQVVSVGATVTLDASATTDLDGGPLGYLWTLTAAPVGSTAVLTDPYALMPEFSADQIGNYKVTLTVFDGTATSGPDTVTISTANVPPVAHAGLNQSANIGDIITLNGSASTDVDGDPLTYLWSLDAIPASSGAMLSDPTAIQPDFQVDLLGEYVVSLIVNDGSADSAPDIVTITTGNTPPVADAGLDQSVTVNNFVQLNGTASSDANSDPLTYLWSLPSIPANSNTSLDNPALQQPGFTADVPGTYVGQLIVNDVTDDSEPDTVVFTTDNVRPVANAGPDQTGVFVGDTVLLDGSGSSDADGTLSGFRWALIKRPSGSAAFLIGSVTATPSFVPDVPGMYIVQLIVDDTVLDSAPDTAVVTVDETALLPAPTLDVGVSPTTDNPYLITGTASPNASVDIYVQGVLQHPITSNLDGSFSVDVHLFDGINEIYATETDGVDSSSPSNTLQVQYDNSIDRNNLPTNISVDTVWTPGSLSQPYVIPSTLTVDPGVQFIILPGSELKFETGASLVINGNLIVAGTSQNRASFTSNQVQQASNDWQGIIVKDLGTINIDYADIEYANIGVQFNPGSGGEIHNSKIANNMIHGIYALGDDVNAANNPLPVITGNSILNNGSRNYAAYAYENAANVVLDATGNWWGTTIPDDIVSKLSDFDSFRVPVIDVRTVLKSANGPVHDVTILHGSLPETNYSVVGKVEIGGQGGQNGSNFLIQSGQSLNIKNGGVLKNGINQVIADGTVIVEGGGVFEGVGGLVVNGSFTLQPDSLLSATSGVQVYGSLIMQSDSIFTTSYPVPNSAFGQVSIYGNWLMYPGSKFKSNSTNYNTAVNVYGVLTVAGLSDNPVILTSKKDSELSASVPGDWGGIHVVDGGYVDINYAQINYADTGILFDSGSSGAVHNSEITNNRIGVRVAGDGVDILNNPAPTVKNNSIYNNSTNYSAHSFVDADSVIVDATDNWWGSTDADTVVGALYHPGAFNVPYINVRHILNGKNGPRYDTEILHTKLTEANTLLSGVFAIGKGTVGYGSLTVKIGETLTLAPRSELNISTADLIIDGNMIMQQGSSTIFNNINAGLLINGGLEAIGTSTNRVNFTSLAKQYVNWNGIIVNDGANVNIDFALIEHARYGLLFRRLSSGSVSNTIFSENTYALYFNGAVSLIITSNTIVDNTYGIYLRNYLGSNPNPSITNNDIYSNGYDLTLQDINSTEPLSITGNWWGTSNTTDIRNSIRAINSDHNALVLLDNVASQANAVSTPLNLSISDTFISPQSSPGTKDNLQLTATFLQSENWRIDIKNDVGQIIKTRSETSNTINYIWNGTDMTSQDVVDGAYSITISVDNIEVYTFNNIVVDNTQPLAQFVGALDGSVINASSFVIKGAANDANFSNYFVEYSQDGVIWTLIDELKTTQVYADSGLANWLIIDDSGLFAPPPPGPLKLRLTVFDEAGNKTVREANTTITTFYVYAVSHDITTIRPVDGIFSTIQFTINAPSTVSLNVLEESTGLIVRTIQQVFNTQGPHQLTWDGKNDSNNYVQDEAYTYEIVASTGLVEASYAPTFTPLGGGVAGVTPYVDYNITRNEFWKLNTVIHFTSRISLCVNDVPVGYLSECDNPGEYFVFDNAPYETGTHLIYWNGRGLGGAVVDNENYGFYYPVPITLPPNTIIVKGTAPFIHGENVAPNIEIKSNPYLVNHSYEEFSQIKFQVDQNSTVTAKLLPPGINDPNDLNAISIIDNLPVIADTLETMTWKGYLDADTNNILMSEEGMYTFTIEATSDVTGFTTLYRGALTLNH